MIIRTFFAKKKPAQAMVEFAIALPVLLLLLYGIIEAGRLLFIYSTVVTASRQAARYGSATGDGTNGIPRYNDCDGIRNAANAVGYLGRFDTITLYHDQGVTNANPPVPINQVPYCSGPTGNLNTRDLEGNRTRLVVTVSKVFHPLVKLVPFPQRTITATSARTILYSVPIVVEQAQQEWFKNPTITTITTDTPDPSEIYQAVNVTITVTGASPAPTGTVEITGADHNCSITLNGSGTGSCTVIFDTAGAKVITAFYGGDTNNLASSDVEDHTVTLLNTQIQVSDSPDPSVKDQAFAVVVTVSNVNGGTDTPTGTVTVSGGGNVNCTFQLSLGMGSCALTFNNIGDKTLTVTYSGDSLHLPSSITEPHRVLPAPPTATSTPTITPIPSNTPIPTITMTPTATLTPTPIPSPVPNCSGINTPGGLTISGNIMSITISNPWPFILTMRDITVTWNDDKGHRTGSDKTLKLQKVAVSSPAPAVIIWTGNTSNQSTLTVPSNATIPPGSSITLSFYFHQTYDNRDGTENIIVNWLTPGCESNPINVH